MDRRELRTIRGELGYTQAKMAFMCGVPERTYRYWEKTSVPSFVTRFTKLLEHPGNREVLEQAALDDLIRKSKAE